MQKDLHIEGTLSTNKTVEALNTTIFQDVGTSNNIIINITGTINLNENQILISDYNQLLKIPIQIRKNGDFGDNTEMTITLGTLEPIGCKRRDTDGNLTDVMTIDILKNGDTFIATFDGSFFIVESKTFLNQQINSAFTEIATIDMRLNNIENQQRIKIYGVRIDKNNPDPKTGVEYTDDAVGITPATMGAASQWDDLFPFNNIRRVMLKNGLPNYYFQKNSKTLKEDGTVADITSGNDGDVMIELPLVYCKFWEDDQYEYKKIATGQINDTWIPIAHRRGNEIRNKAYTGAYKGYVDSAGKLRSLNGVIPSTSEVNMSLSKARSSAQLNGPGYDAQIYQITQLVQTLYLIKYKNRNSQSAIGMGFVNATWDGTKKAKSTGATNNRPIDWGEQTGLQQMCLFGIEDFWGNVWEWNEGIIKKTDDKIYLSNTGFNDNGNNYTFVSLSAPQGYISKTTRGFLPTQTVGSTNMYYCDHFWFAAGTLVAGLFGGDWDRGADVGCFCLHLNDAPSSVGVTLGARLCFL